MDADSIQNSVLVSVIIPVYNVESYLARCVRSVLEQTYKNLELVLVDDGSTDGSGVLCEKLKQTDDRIIVIHKTNEGPSSARNAGMEKATGKFFLFCDSDDTVEPDWMECLISAAIEHQDSAVICGYKVLDEKGILLRTECAPEGFYNKSQYYEFFSQTGISWNKAFCSDLIRMNNLTFDEQIRYSEDVLFFLDYLLLVNNVFLVGKTPYNYYHYSTQTRKTLTSDISYYQMKPIYDRRIGYISDEHLSAFNKLYFGNIYSRFELLTERERIPDKIRIKEAKDIVYDPVFREFLAEYGEEHFDPISLKLLKSGKVEQYCVLQHMAKLKRSILD